MTYVKGQYFVIASILVVFALYLFSLAIIKQEIPTSEDMKEMEISDEILFHANTSIASMDLSKEKETYVALLYLQRDISLISTLLNFQKVKLQYTYNETLRRWNISLIIDSPHVYVVKMW